MLLDAPIQPIQPLVEADPHPVKSCIEADLHAVQSLIDVVEVAALQIRLEPVTATRATSTAIGRNSLDIVHNSPATAPAMVTATVAKGRTSGHSGQISMVARLPSAFTAVATVGPSGPRVENITGARVSSKQPEPRV